MSEVLPDGKVGELNFTFAEQKHHYGDAVTSLCAKRKTSHCGRQKGGELLKESQLRTYAKAFALHVLDVCDTIDTRKGRGVLVNQVVRSSTLLM